MQFVAVAAVVILLPDELRVLPGLPTLIRTRTAVVVGVWFVNLANFMDGLDWMTVAEVVPVTAGLAIFGAGRRAADHGLVVASPCAAP